MRQRVVGSLLGLLVAPALLAGQASLDRPPNLLGTWVPDPAVLQFNFLHRFYVSPAPSRSVLNFPTFTFALGLPQRIALGTRYSTRAETPGKTNEIEVFARWRVLSGGHRPIAVAVTPAWDGSSKSVNGELSVDWTRRHLTLSGAVRGMTQPFGAKPAKAALAGGAVLRLNNYVALGGDVASILSPDSTEKAAWSAGLLFVIPGSPHTFSLHASNVMVNTTEGSSKRGSFFGLAKVVYGFEFTIPIHFARFAPWFHGNPKPAVVGNAAPSATGPVAAEVRVGGYRFTADSVVIAAGQTVRWVNADFVEHTITFDGAEPGSPLISPNGTWAHRFDRPGSYTYHCTPHPFMTGVVIVR